MTIEKIITERLGNPRVGPVPALREAMDEISKHSATPDLVVLSGRHGDFLYCFTRIDTRKGTPRDLHEAIDDSLESFTKPASPVGGSATTGEGAR